METNSPPTLHILCKKSGLDGTRELLAITGIKRRTAHEWFKSKRQLIECLIIGAGRLKKLRELDLLD